MRHMLIAVVVLLLCYAEPSWGATAFVQSTSTSGFNGATPQLTFTSNVGAGGVIAVLVYWRDTTVTLSSVTDSLSNSYTLHHNPVTGNSGRAAGAYARNIAGGAAALTVTFSADPGMSTIIAHEISGTDTSSPLDGSALQHQDDPGTGTDAVTSGSITTTANGDYIFGATSEDSFFASTINAGTGFTLQETGGSADQYRSEDGIQASAGSIAATFTNTNSPFADYFTLLMAFKPAGEDAQLWSGIIDAARAIDWAADKGVPGGIPNRTVICSTIAPYTGTAATINSAIAACPAGQVVKLNAGTFNLSTGVTFIGVSNVTLRGAGTMQTKLVFTGGDSCFGSPSAKAICMRGSSGTYPEVAVNVGTWTAGFAKGTSVITLSSVTGLAVGEILVLDQCNDGLTTASCTGTEADPGDIFNCGALGPCSIQGPATGDARRNVRLQNHMAEVTAINGNDVTISPPLYMPNWRSAQNPAAWKIGTVAGTAKGNGVEDLTLDYTATAGSEAAGVAFANAWGNWVLRVRGLGPPGRANVHFAQSGRNEIRDSYFYGSGGVSTSYGVESFQGHSNVIINNILHHVVSPLISGGGAGNIFAYNYAIDMSRTDFPNLTGAIWNHHTGGTGMDLVESNQSDGRLTADTFHGTSNMVTLFRNQVFGREGSTTSCTQPVTIWAFHRYYNVIGNVLGQDGYHTTYEVVTPTAPSHTAIFNLGDHNACGISSDPPNDSLVATTLMRWGNCDIQTDTCRFVSGEVPSGLSIYANAVPGNNNLPASFFLSARPSWWGYAGTAIAWPAIGPDVTGGNVANVNGRANKIPAQVCYENSAFDGTNLYKEFDPTFCYQNVSEPAGPDFSLAASPASRTVGQGAGTSYVVTVGAADGFAGTVELQVSGMPAGAVASFNPRSILNSGNSTLTVTTDATTIPGSYSLKIRGTSGASVREAGVTLVVQQRTFSLSVSPTSRSVRRGGSRTYTVMVTPSGGFTGVVSFSVSGSPPNATATFSLPSVTTSGTTTMRVTTRRTAPATPLGTYRLAITGTGGGLSRQKTVTLIVRP